MVMIYKHNYSSRKPDEFTVKSMCMHDVMAMSHRIINVRTLLTVVMADNLHTECCQLFCKRLVTRTTRVFSQAMADEHQTAATQITHKSLK